MVIEVLSAFELVGAAAASGILAAITANTADSGP